MTCTGLLYVSSKLHALAPVVTFHMQPVTMLGKKPLDSDLLEAEDVWHVAEAHAQAHSAVFSVTSSLHPQQTQSSRRTASSGPTSNSAAVQGCDLDSDHPSQGNHVRECGLT